MYDLSLADVQESEPSLVLFRPRRLRVRAVVSMHRIRLDLVCAGNGLWQGCTFISTPAHDCYRQDFWVWLWHVAWGLRSQIFVLLPPLMEGHHFSSLWCGDSVDQHWYISVHVFLRIWGESTSRSEVYVTWALIQSCQDKRARGLIICQMQHSIL